jgi:hypothetical protein
VSNRYYLYAQFLDRYILTQPRPRRNDKYKNVCSQKSCISLTDGMSIAQNGRDDPNLDGPQAEMTG